MAVTRVSCVRNSLPKYVYYGADALVRSRTPGPAFAPEQQGRPGRPPRSRGTTPPFAISSLYPRFQIRRAPRDLNHRFGNLSEILAVPDHVRGDGEAL